MVVVQENRAAIWWASGVHLPCGDPPGGAGVAWFGGAGFVKAWAYALFPCPCAQRRRRKRGPQTQCPPGSLARIFPGSGIAGSIASSPRDGTAITSPGSWQLT